MPVLARPTNQKEIRAVVPISKLIYQLAVEFCSIKLTWDNEEVEIICDEGGEILDH
nr:hypothetical protein [Candidatus Freyarchaeota archaeon]